MVSFNLTTMARRARPGMRRKSIVIRDIIPPTTLATDLFQIYSPALDIWSRAIPSIIDEYERTLSGMTRDSAEDLSSRIGAAESEFQRLLLVLTPELRDWAWRTERWYRGKWASAVKAATEVDLSMLIGPEGVRETVEAVIGRNVALVKDVSAEAQRKISDSVFRGLTERKPAAAVAKELREHVDMGRARSRRIASDQLSKASAALAQERRREAGLRIFKHRHSGKLHPRRPHLARNGHIFSEDPADVGKVVEGKTVEQAPPADDRAGVPPFCGCREQSCLVFSFDEDE